MAKSSSTVAGVAERYAGSLHDLAEQAGEVAAVEAALGQVERLIADSDDFRRLIESPVFSADEQFAAISAIADKAGLDGLVGNFLRVVARNRRLFAIPAMIRAFRRIAAERRGEISAEVSSAHELTAAQEKELREALRQIAGKDVAFTTKVEPELLAGLVVRLGSRQIDTSLRTKLNSLKLALKEVG